MENKYFELLEKYLLGKMSDEERRIFEERLKSDADLETEKERLEEYILAIEYGNLKETLSQYKISEEEMSGEENFSFPDDAPADKTRILNLRPWVVAASVLLIGWAGYFLFSNLNSQPDLHFEKIFYSDPGLPTMMGGNDRYLFYDAMVDYKAGEYEEAIGKWSEVSDIGRDTLDYYIGMAWLNLKEWEEAEQFLQQIPAESSLKNKSDWYRVRIYIALEEYEKAAQALEKVPENREGYQEVKTYLSSKIK